MKASLRQIEKAATSQGFVCKRTKKGLVVLGRSPQDGQVLIHGTESDRRAEKNTAARLKRLGLTL